MRRAALLLLLVIFISSSAVAKHVVFAGTPIDLSAPPGVFISGSEGFAGQWVAQRFSLSVRSHVKVVEIVLLPLETFGEPPFSALVQLTNAIGPGTTQANMLASAVFSPAVANLNALLRLKTNLLLPAGNYYLVVSTHSAISIPTDQFQWPFGGTGIIGEVAHGFYFTGSSAADTNFPPGSHWSFVFTDGLGPLMFQVRGVRGDDRRH